MGKETPLDRYGEVVPVRLGGKGPKIPKESRQQSKALAVAGERSSSNADAVPSFAGVDSALEALQRALNQNAKQDNADGVKACVRMQEELDPLPEGHPAIGQVRCRVPT